LAGSIRLGRQKTYKGTHASPLLVYAPTVWSVLVAPPAAASFCLVFRSFTAALMASSASMLQCNFTGGSCVVKKNGAIVMAVHAMYRRTKAKVESDDEKEGKEK